MRTDNRRHTTPAWLRAVAPAALVAALAPGAGGCSMVTDSAESCPAELRVRFVYDYNIKDADAFAKEVRSVDVWAFDTQGALVWSGSASGAELAADGFRLDTGLPEGRYDFVAWCGLRENTGFDLATYRPSSKEELEVTLRTRAEEDRQVCSDRLPGLWHGMVSDISYAPDPFSPSYKTVTIPLVKDTKRIRVMLQHLDGSPIDRRDFTASITAADGRLAWNNSLMPSPTVTYEPFDVYYGSTAAPDGTGDLERPAAYGGFTRAGTLTEVSALMFSFATSRLTEAQKEDVYLTVHRGWDDRDIIHIPIVKYLLMVRDRYGDWDDQEYLDRQDEWSVVFFIDKASNWYQADGIFINNWAVVPPQEEEL